MSSTPIGPASNQRERVLQRRRQEAGEGGGNQNVDPALAGLTGIQSPGPVTPSRSNSEGQHIFGTAIQNTTSILGRRPRLDSLTEWEPVQKKHIIEYSSALALQHGIPIDEREEFVQQAQLPTHLLLVSIMGKLYQNTSTSRSVAFSDYMKSASFKENVVGKVRSILMDPELPSYKEGRAARIERHIRLNPTRYRIPSEFHGEISSNDFISALGGILTNARAELKRKMNAHWAKKTDIYQLVRKLSWNATQEMTDAVWARWAWIQVELVKFNDLLERKQVVDDFWKYIDDRLDEIRDADEDLPLDERKEIESLIFADALKYHHSECPPKKKMKSTPIHQIPAWQRAITEACAEMAEYSQEDLVDEEPTGEENIPDDEPEPGPSDGEDGLPLPGQ